MNIDNFIYLLDNPQVYSGKEINVVKKEPGITLLNICLAFPDQYEIGMSHYGTKILYNTLNNMNDVRAERCYLPEVNSIKKFQTHNVPLFSLENRTPIKKFDLLGISLLSELNFTNILELLQLAQIPLKSRQRSNIYPLVAAGGISSCNPEPLRDYFDFFAFGDGEIIFPDILTVLRKQKKNPQKKASLLKALAEIPGLYVPALHPIEKVNKFYLPKITRRIHKQSLKNLDQIHQYDNPLVPITNVVFNRLNIEIARGCLQNCRFCQARSYYSPYRTASLEKTIQAIKLRLEQTGFEAFSLSSLSSGDYPYINDLLTLIPKVITPCTSFSVPSLRPSTLSTELLHTLSLFRRTGLTIVPEAGSERLRRVINKDVSDREIFQAVELALRFNWRKIKLYFMIGLPGETESDLKSIVDLISSIINLAKDKGKKIDLHTSFSSFVPKPHSPLQWYRREDLNSLQSKIDFLKKNLRRYRSVDLDFHNPQIGVIETVLARGDARVGELVLQAQQQGQIFTAWDKHFNYSIWQKLINDLGLHCFLEEIDIDQRLPWDFIKINFTQEYLQKEYQKARQELSTPSCVHLSCSSCKGCVFPTPQSTSTNKPVIHSANVITEPKTYNKTRIFYKKLGDFRLFSHLSLMKYVERLIRKSGLIFRSTEGFHPRMKLTFLPPLPVFASGLQEVAELYVQVDLSAPAILERLKKVAGDFQFLNVKLCSQSPTLAKDTHMVNYLFETETEPASWEKINGMLKENESIENEKGRLHISMDFSQNGQERFAQIYRLLDPERRQTRYLCRTSTTFKSDLKTGEST